MLSLDLMYYKIQVLAFWVNKHYENKIIMDGRRNDERDKKINA